MPRERLALIRVSEIGEYAYCARAWWLRRVAGLEPTGHERRELGVVMHQRHGRAVATSGLLIWIGAFLIIAALLLIVLR
jgi:CRISPR/Cas system-associated exonuclease Cas4 (RecB family)